MFNQTLKRPMFRRGGSAGGITSGLSQGYKDGDLAKIRRQLNLFKKCISFPLKLCMGFNITFLFFLKNMML